jgi:hypothetical protein
MCAELSGGLLAIVSTHADGPVPLAELLATCRVRNATLCERITALTAAGHLVRSADGYRLAGT